MMTVDAREGTLGVFLGSSLPRMLGYYPVGRHSNQDKINTRIQMIASSIYNVVFLRLARQNFTSRR